MNVIVDLDAETVLHIDAARNTGGRHDPGAAHRKLCDPGLPRSIRPEALSLELGTRREVVRHHTVRRPDLDDFAPLEPRGSSAEAPDRCHVVAHEQDRSPCASNVVHLADAPLLELDV